MKMLNKKSLKNRRRFSRLCVTFVVYGVPCGRCSACLSDYRLKCLHPVRLRLRRKIFGGDFFANSGDDCPF